MNRIIEKLEEILSFQSDIYKGIFGLEKEKNEAIINRAGKVIEELSNSQEKLLSEIDTLEKERESLMDDYRKFALFRHGGEELTLTEIIDSVDQKSGSRLKKAGAELKRILLKVKNVQELNSALLRDNMEFYDILLSGLKNGSTMKAGYGSDGREQSGLVNPVLFNIKA